MNFAFFMLLIGMFRERCEVSGFDLNEPSCRRRLLMYIRLRC